ncbi:DUF1287 domain-containing protein [Lysobacter maris]|uniref:DUF1287 domain-containing protein n=1 Tax=Marilutibacter maris TaxID=1605891 RepID=A0A508A6R8_9GAMM|nr:DUF1287 domain-containing protein [Lysobacter maris]KAB8172887.1 DUF1287 domain-containing protein [Lysobacter maris]
MITLAALLIAIRLPPFGAAPVDPVPEVAPATATVGEARQPPASDPARSEAQAPPRVRAARARIGRTRLYDPAYVALDYPGGDVAEDRGVCSDVVVRALRAEGLDLQQAVHEDMRAHFDAYPQRWGLRRPDRNIDHRRVPNLERWFERQGWLLPLRARAGDYRPGDLVSWRLPGSGLPHIGIVSDRRGSDGVPLIIHNVGHGTREENVLFAYTLNGHYRPPPH